MMTFNKDECEALYIGRKKPIHTNAMVEVVLQKGKELSGVSAEHH